MNFVSGSEFSPVVLHGTGNLMSPLVLGVNLNPESTDGVTGLIMNFELATLAVGAIDETVILGSLSFTLNSGVTDGVDIVPGIFQIGVDSVVSLAGDLTMITNFVGAHVDGGSTGPEVPSLSPLAIATLLSLLGLAGWRRLRE